MLVPAYSGEGTAYWLDGRDEPGHDGSPMRAAFIVTRPGRRAALAQTPEL